MAIASVDVTSVPVSRLVRAFLNLFCFALAGYAVLGRSFAYLGFPPFYIGEITLALGIAAALTAGNLTSAILNLPGLSLALLMLWTAFRTIPYWNTYGLDAPRDAMIVFYGLFSYVIASLILRRPATLTMLIERYKRFIPFVIFLAPITPIVAYLSGDGKLWSSGSFELTGAKVVDVCCHLTAVIAFSLAGFVRLRFLALIFILLVGLFGFSQERQAMLTFIVGCSIAAVFSPKRHALRNVLAIAGVLAVIVGVLAAVDFRIPGKNVSRAADVRQLVINATNIFSEGASDRGDATREWRLNWWSDITAYTIHGPYFWNGKGFGENLADADGYQTNSLGAGEPVLRSPHNAHMTILARGGVPALVLWVLALGSWLFAVVRQLIKAKQLRDNLWAGVFTFLLAYWTIMVLSGSVDVALEGPVLGIWFWTIHGVGLAALILHRHRVTTMRSPRVGGAGTSYYPALQ